MLKTDTEQKRKKVESILEDTCIRFLCDDCFLYDDEGLHIDDWISFDKMAEVVDYLREFEKEPYKSEKFNGSTIA